jgi:hypothetical protein
MEGWTADMPRRQYARRSESNACITSVTTSHISDEHTPSVPQDQGQGSEPRHRCASGRIGQCSKRGGGDARGSDGPMTVVALGEVGSTRGCGQTLSRYPRNPRVERGGSCPPMLYRDHAHHDRFPRGSPGAWAWRYPLHPSERLVHMMPKHDGLTEDLSQVEAGLHTCNIYGAWRRLWHRAARVAAQHALNSP